MKEFIFTWKIENVNYAWHKTNESINSPSFIAGPIQNSTWSLQLYPRGYEDPGYFGLYLQRGADGGPEALSINFELSCISADNSPLYTFKFTEADKSFPQNGCGFGPPCFISRYEVCYQRRSLYLHQYILKLRCRMWIDGGGVNEFGRSSAHTLLPIERILSVEVLNAGIFEETAVNIDSKLQNKSLISIKMLNHENSTRVEINPTNTKNVRFSILKLSFMNKTTQKNLCEHRCSWLGEPKRGIYWLPLVNKSKDTGNKNSFEDSVEVLGEYICSTGEITEYSETEDSSRLSELISKYITSSIPSGKISELPRISLDMWRSKDLRDVKLTTPSTSFSAHKFVLCARSPVFLAMLTGDMKEKINECIEIDDIGDNILDKFLLFLYTDTFEDIDWDTVMDLYYTSDKYQVERLKLLCCSFLLNNINVYNVSELLLLADKHHDADLKERVDDFILQNDEEVFSSLTWKQFVKEQPFLPAMTMVLKYDHEREKENDADTYDQKLLNIPTVQDDFTAAYQAGIVSDVAIKTTSTTLNAHKSVLCASSAILKEKFTKDSKNEPTEILEITDFEDDIVSRLLVFLYSDSLGDVLWSTATELYHAADVYQIQRLKIKCSCFLLENLDISNASDLLLLAHKHRDAQLKSAVEDYIFLHDEEIFGSDQWADFSETNLLLANEKMRMKYKKN